jgi:hypothetical protein
VLQLFQNIFRLSRHVLHNLPGGFNVVFLHRTLLQVILK